MHEREATDEARTHRSERADDVDICCAHSARAASSRREDTTGRQQRTCCAAQTTSRLLHAWWMDTSGRHAPDRHPLDNGPRSGAAFVTSSTQQGRHAAAPTSRDVTRGHVLFAPPTVATRRELRRRRFERGRGGARSVSRWSSCAGGGVVVVVVGRARRCCPRASRSASACSACTCSCARRECGMSASRRCRTRTSPCGGAPRRRRSGIAASWCATRP